MQRESWGRSGRKGQLLVVIAGQIPTVLLRTGWKVLFKTNVEKEMSQTHFQGGAGGNSAVQKWRKTKLSSYFFHF